MFPILPVAWSIVTSRLGSTALLCLAAFLYGHHVSAVDCAAREATAIAAAQQVVVIERAREAKAADELRAKDRLNLHMAEAHADAMQAEIDRLNQELANKDAPRANAPHPPATDDCRIDAARARRVRSLDEAANR